MLLLKGGTFYKGSTCYKIGPVPVYISFKGKEQQGFLNTSLFLKGLHINVRGNTQPFLEFIDQRTV